MSYGYTSELNVTDKSGVPGCLSLGRGTVELLYGPWEPALMNQPIVISSWKTLAQKTSTERLAPPGATRKEEAPVIAPPPAPTHQLAAQHVRSHDEYGKSGREKGPPPAICKCHFVPPVLWIHSSLHACGRCQQAFY